MSTEITQDRILTISESAANVVVDLLAEQGRIIESLKSKFSALAKENQELRAEMEVKDAALKRLRDCGSSYALVTGGHSKIGEICDSALTLTAGRDLLDRVEKAESDADEMRQDCTRLEFLIATGRCVRYRKNNMSIGYVIDDNSARYTARTYETAREAIDAEIVAVQQALAVELAEALDILRSLHDFQNGSPLEKHRIGWEIAMNCAEAILSKHGK